MDKEGSDIDADELKQLEEENEAETGVAGPAILPANSKRVVASTTDRSGINATSPPNSNRSSRASSVASSASSVSSVSSSTTSSISNNEASQSPVALSSTHGRQPSSEEKTPLVPDDGASAGSDADVFDDGFDDDLMGDAHDRARLEALTEKERETEIFKRIERRDLMRTRWEIKRKLKLAKRAAVAAASASSTAAVPSKSSVDVVAAPVSVSVYTTPTVTANAVPISHDPSMFEPMDFNDDSDVDERREYFDPKERSKERKKNVEANRTDDKRSSAMAMLKAKREDKAKRGKQKFEKSEAFKNQLLIN